MTTMGTPVDVAVAEFGIYKSPLKVTPSTVRKSTRVDAVIFTAFGIGLSYNVCNVRGLCVIILSNDQYELLFTDSWEEDRMFVSVQDGCTER